MDLKITEALRGYGVTRATGASAEEGGNNLLGRAAQDFAATVRESEAVASLAMTSIADSHALVEA